MALSVRVEDCWEVGALAAPASAGEASEASARLESAAEQVRSGKRAEPRLDGDETWFAFGTGGAGADLGPALLRGPWALLGDILTTSSLLYDTI